jgi:hypothetical protein
MSEPAYETEAPPAAAEPGFDLGGEEWSVDDNFGPDPNADLGYGGNELLPEEVAAMADEALREQVGPVFEEILAAQLAPYREALAWTQEQQANASGAERAQEIVDEIAQGAELDAEELVAETDQFLEASMSDPNLREEVGQYLRDHQPELVNEINEELRRGMDPQQAEALFAAAQQGDPQAIEALEVAAMFTPTVAELALRGFVAAKTEVRPRDERELLARWNGMTERPAPEPGTARNERELLARWRG